MAWIAEKQSSAQKKVYIIIWSRVFQNNSSDLIRLYLSIELAQILEISSTTLNEFYASCNDGYVVLHFEAQHIFQKRQFLDNFLFKI